MMWLNMPKNQSISKFFCRKTLSNFELPKEEKKVIKLFVRDGFNLQSIGLDKFLDYL